MPVRFVAIGDPKFEFLNVFDRRKRSLLNRYVVVQLATHRVTC